MKGEEQRGTESLAGKQGPLGLLEKCREQGSQTLRLAPLRMVVVEGGSGAAGVVCYGPLPSPCLHRTEVGIKGQEGVQSPSPISRLCPLQGHPAQP